MKQVLKVILSSLLTLGLLHVAIADTIDYTHENFISDTDPVNSLTTTRNDELKQTAVTQYDAALTAYQAALAAKTAAEEAVANVDENRLTAQTKTYLTEIDNNVASALADLQRAELAKNRAKKRAARRLHWYYRQRNELVTTKRSRTQLAQQRAAIRQSNAIDKHTTALNTSTRSSVETYKTECEAEKDAAKTELDAAVAAKAEIDALPSIPTNEEETKITQLASTIATLKTTLDTDVTQAQAAYDDIVAKCADIESRYNSLSAGENINGWFALRNNTHSTRVVNYAASANQPPYVAGYGSHPHQIWHITTQGGFSRFANKETPSQCISLSSSTVNATVGNQSCGSSSNDHWEIIANGQNGNGENLYQFKSVPWGTCMSMRSGYTATGQFNKMYMKTCNSSDGEQLWTLPRRYGNSASITGQYYLVNKKYPTLVISAPQTNQYVNGGNPILTTLVAKPSGSGYLFNANQQWTITASGDYAARRVANVANGYTLNLQTASVGSGAKPNMWEPVVHPDQQWLFTPVPKAGDTQYYLIQNNRYHHSCFNASTGSDGSNVTMETCSSLNDPDNSATTASQLWKLVQVQAPTHPSISTVTTNGTNYASSIGSSPDRYKIIGKGALWMPIDETKDITFTGNIRFVGNSFAADGFGIGMQCQSPSSMGRGAGWVGLAGYYSDTAYNLNYRGYGFLLQSWSSNNAIRVAHNTDPNSIGQYTLAQSNLRGTFIANRNIPFKFTWNASNKSFSIVLDRTRSYGPYTITDSQFPRGPQCYLGLTAAVGGYSQEHQVIIGDVIQQ